MQLGGDITKPGIGGNQVDNGVRVSYKGKTSLGIAKALIENRGILGGLYCGASIQVQRDIIASAMYFGSYETIKQSINHIRNTESTDQVAVGIAGGGSGVLSFLISYPHDTVRTRYQKSCLMTAPGQAKIPKLEIFARTMWQGCGIGMARSFAVHSAMFLGFEFFKRFINRLEI